MDSQDYKFWNNKVKLLDNLTLTGYSRSTKRTGFIIPELDFFLDAGVYTTQPAKYIFITHTHSDHIYELPRIINYSNKPIIYVPESSKKYVEKYIDSLLQLTTNNSKINYKKYCSIIGIKDLDILELKHKNHDYIIEPIKCDHGITSFGYGFSEKRKKIKE
jgi:ribonuclease BN (tRNA processing enzyme)